MQCLKEKPWNFFNCASGLIFNPALGYSTQHKAGS